MNSSLLEKTLFFFSFLEKTLKESLEQEIQPVNLFFSLIIYLLFLAMLGHHYYASSSLLAVSRGFSLIAVHRLLIAVASLVAKHRF